jgi:hypothetical protein
VFEEPARRIAGRIDIPWVLIIGASSIAADFLMAASDRAGLSLREAADGSHNAKRMILRPEFSPRTPSRCPRHRIVA